MQAKTQQVMDIGGALSLPYEIAQAQGSAIDKLAKTIKEGTPATKIFIQTILPINNQQYLDEKPQVNFLWPSFYPSVNQQINETNKLLRNNNEFEVIDLHPLFLNDNSVMKKSFSKDGVHLNESGYNVWIAKVKPLIDNINPITN